MQVIVNGTSEVKTLSIIDPQTGVNYIGDFMGQYDVVNDGQFGYDEETQTYSCDQETFDWWSKVLDDNQALEDRIRELCDQYGSERVYGVVADAGYVDLEDHAAWVNQCLDGHFGENN